MLLSTVILLFSFSIGAHAGGVAQLVPNCTDADGKYLETAVNCENTLDASYCTWKTGESQMYVVDSTYYAAKKGDDAKLHRIPQCYSNIAVATADPLPQKAFIDAAVMTCPRTCGFCCMTPKYKCKDADDPVIKCEIVTDAMCKDPKWRDTIAVNCPSKCGFCLDGGCVDTAVDCDKDPKICTKATMATFAKANCKRTCGFCATNSTTGTGTGTCGDSHPNCVNWVHNGFCQSNGYTLDQKKMYCGRSCGLC